MSQYFATFPAGTWDIIAKHLKSFRLDEIEIVEHDDSSVVFQSSLTTERLIELRYFTNIYLIVDNQKLPDSVLKGKHFRLMMLKDGKPQPIDDTERAELEAKIIHNYGLEPNAHLSKNDFYVIERSYGKRLLALRLPKAKFKREKLSYGELRPELAHILCLAVGLKAKYTVVDMFAGYGSLPLEVIRGFGCKQVIAVDSQKMTGRHEHSSIKWHKADARNLNFITDESIDRVVTDPPWGVYDSKIDDLTTLYTDFAKEMVRILKPSGIAVVLSGFNEAEQCFEQTYQLQVIKKWNVLVSGKKATIYKLKKIK